MHLGVMLIPVECCSHDFVLAFQIANEMEEARRVCTTNEFLCECFSSGILALQMAEEEDELATRVSTNIAFVRIVG